MDPLASLPHDVRQSVEMLDAQCTKPTLVQIGDYGDKYNLESTADVDCASRFELCKGICCRLELALSRQEINEGIVAWNPNRPYLCAKGDDGRCVHQDRQTGGCGVYEHRPAICRTYHCRNDKRIWLDFEGRKINPKIHEAGWPIWVDENGEWPE